MKSGGPLQRKTGLKRTSGLARGTSELSRGAPLSRGKPLERGGPMVRAEMKRKPADNHLTGDEWAEVYRLLLVRSGGRCEGGTPWCLAPGGRVDGMPRGRVSIQHRRAQGAGGTALTEANTLSNFLTLCGSGVTGCHGWVETRERAAALDLGLWVRHEYDNGFPVPVWRYPVTLPSGRRVYLHPEQPRYLDEPYDEDLPALAG